MRRWLFPCVVGNLILLNTGCGAPDTAALKFTSAYPIAGTGDLYDFVVRLDGDMPLGIGKYTQKGNEYQFRGTLVGQDDAWIVVRVDSMQLVIPRERVEFFRGEVPVRPAGKTRR
jgi:hypothetical protein